MPNKSTLCVLPADYAKYVRCFILLLFILLAGCGETRRYEDFTFVGSEGKTEAAFNED